ncbi:hypothetical protein J3F84DRAFT_364382 [Trichoderma pleuroticola]
MAYSVQHTRSLLCPPLHQLTNSLELAAPKISNIRSRRFHIWPVLLIRRKARAAPGEALRCFLRNRRGLFASRDGNSPPNKRPAASIKVHRPTPAVVKYRADTRREKKGQVRSRPASIREKMRSWQDVLGNPERGNHNQASDMMPPSASCSCSWLISCTRPIPEPIPRFTGAAAAVLYHFLSLFVGRSLDCHRGAKSINKAKASKTERFCHRVAALGQRSRRQWEN